LKKKQPARARRTVIYGVHPVIETLRAGRRQIQEIYLAREPLPQWNLTAILEAADIRLTRLSPNELLSIAGSPNHQGFAAQVGPFPYAEFSEVLSASADQQGPLLILDEIQDPANLGSILRSGECLGVAAVILSKDRSVAVTLPWKTSAGAPRSPWPGWRFGKAMDGLKEPATDLRDRFRSRGVCFNRPHRQGCISIGIGRKGYPPLVRENAIQVSIPMAGKVGSLNVSRQQLFC
jgi:23S rRNA (guanosine2251-2'-O)-methyltransferase